ncbi:sterol desaturase family protein [Altererythrobacter litoralis]|uniref:Sterol desaturase family protein n=1 Tax=Altererythrobacter litoralis TaxID=3113904 RepID=A0ABU7GF43_9SPHN|nr:sterol desaturase family protein [Erythrobacteraceae bacterium 1XM1-14]
MLVQLNFKQTIRRLLEYTVYPVLLIAFLGSFASALDAGVAPGIALLSVTIVHMTIIAVLEIVMPARLDWSWLKDRQVFNDIVHGILLDFGGQIGKTILTILLVTLFTSSVQGTVWAIWPTTWPFVLQLALAIVIYDFGDYWKHRAYHQWKWAWPIHVLHHNPPLMHVFKGGRLHFIESVLRAGLVSAPFVIFGAGAEIVWWIAAIGNGLGGQNHWNVKTRIPAWLDAVLVTPNTHWLHHAKADQYRLCNLSPITLWNDHLFGTFYRQPKEGIADVGVSFDPVPRNVFSQILTPFIWPWLVRNSRTMKSSSEGETGVGREPA